MYIAALLNVHTPINKSINQSIDQSLVHLLYNYKTFKRGPEYTLSSHIVLLWTITTVMYMCVRVIDFSN
jgi:hypothetical protein